MNDVGLIGRIVDEGLTPRQTTTGKTVLNFVVAVPSGNDTAFVDCVAWSNIATLICDKTRKGSQIGINGALKTDWYEDTNGVKRKSTVIVVSHITLI